jgi:hypothetical protein
MLRNEAYRRHPAAGALTERRDGEMEERPEEKLDQKESIEEEAPEVEGHRKRFDVEEEGVGRKRFGAEEEDLDKGRKR